MQVSRRGYDSSVPILEAGRGQEGRPVVLRFDSAPRLLKSDLGASSPAPHGESRRGPNLTTRRGRAPEGMEEQRPRDGVEAPSGATEGGGTELHGACGRGQKTRRRRQASAREDPNPAPAATGRQSLPSALSARARRERRARRAPRPAPKCPRRPRALASPRAAAPPQPLSRESPQLFKSRTVSSPFAQEAGAPFPDERRRSHTLLTAKLLADETPAPGGASVGPARVRPRVPRGARLLRPGSFAAN